MFSLPLDHVACRSGGGWTKRITPDHHVSIIKDVEWNREGQTRDNRVSSALGLRILVRPYAIILWFENIFHEYHLCPILYLYRVWYAHNIILTISRILRKGPTIRRKLALYKIGIISFSRKAFFQNPIKYVTSLNSLVEPIQLSVKMCLAGFFITYIFIYVAVL